MLQCEDATPKRKNKWLVQMGLGAMQRKDSSLEDEFEMGSWTKEMRRGKSTINGGKGLMETLMKEITTGQCFRKM